MKKIRFVVPCIVILMFAFVLGCGGVQKPNDLPPLFPCKISVIQDGKPLSGASVYFVADGHDLRFTVGGVTNESGVAIIHTDVEWKGAPAGKYKITIKKLEIPDSGVSNEVPTGEKELAEYKKKLEESSKNIKSLVHSKFLRPLSTPLSIEVKQGGSDQSCDVGAAVNEFWDDISGSSSQGKH